MSKRVRLKNLVKLLKEGELDIREIKVVSVWVRNGRSVIGMDLRLDDPDVDVVVELDGDFGSNQLHKELVRLGVRG